MVGYETEGGYARVLRYTFTTPASGASKVSFSTSAYIYEYDGSSKLTLIDWCITSDATSHLGAVTANGANSLGTVSLTYDTDDRYSASGSASVALLPNTTYYLWFFPKTTTYTIWEWQPSTVTLTTTAAISSVSAPNGYIEDTVKISISRYSSAFTHALAYSLDGGNTYTTIASSVGTTYTWTIPASVYDSLSSTDTSISCRIRCRTYNGSTLIGASYCTITLMVDSILNAPAISASWSISPDINSLTGAADRVVLNYHELSITVKGTAKNGATIASYWCSHGDETVKASTGSFTATEDSIGYGVTDSRGFSTIGGESLTTVAYIKPTLRFSAIPPDSQTGETTVKATGQWFNGSFGSASNTLAVQYRYKVSGGTYGSWTAATLSKSGNTYTGTATLTLDYTKKYVFQMRVTDALQTVTSAAYTVTTVPVFDWSDTDFAFNVPVYINGRLVMTDGLVYEYRSCADDAAVDAFIMEQINDSTFANRTKRNIVVYPTASGTTLTYGQMWFLELWKSSASYGAITAKTYANSGVSVWRRQWNTNKLIAWEQENPALAVGKEYRTTEKMSGHPVYCQRLGVTLDAWDGTAAPVTITIPHGIADFDTIVRISGRNGNTALLPYFGSSGSLTVLTGCGAENITLRSTAKWSSSYWTFDIYYTKTS